MNRSAEHLVRGQQLYAVIEFCQTAENLWGKIESGHWDWLGVKEQADGRRTFVVGRPAIARGGVSGSATVRAKGADGRHRVLVRTPGRPPSGDELVTEDDARARYERTIEELRTGVGSSGLWRVSLYVDNQLVAEEFVVRAIPNQL
jgi:hypothetical protein